MTVYIYAFLESHEVLKDDQVDEVTGYPVSFITRSYVYIDYEIEEKIREAFMESKGVLKDDQVDEVTGYPVSFISQLYVYI